MENCVIYSHQLKFDKIIEIVKAKLPKAKIETFDSEDGRHLKATQKGGLFGKTKTLKVNYRQRLNPSYKLDKIECGLTQNLSGMVNFIQSFPAKNTEVRNQLLYKVLSVNCEMPYIGEPEITAEFLDILKEILIETDSIVFAQPNKIFRKSPAQHFLDKNLNLILDAGGNCEIDRLEVNVDAKYQNQNWDDVQTNT